MKLITALATPFKNDKIDLRSFKRLLKMQEKFADALLCCGTTGEVGMLSAKEKHGLIETTKNCGVPVWTGVGGATKNAVCEAKAAQKCGADGVLVAPPSFFKCTKLGFVWHVEEILQVGLPVMLYNAPSRCGYELWEDAVFQLARHGVCLKDAGGNAKYAKNVASAVTVFCGNDEKTEEYVLKGGASGLVSVVSNAFPRLTRHILQFKANDEQRNAFAELCKLAFCEINPIPIKYILHTLGVFDTCEMRLPLTAANAAKRNAIDEFLNKNADVF